MRELSISDLNVVAGGEYSTGDLIAIGGALGGGVGLSLAAQFGLSATNGMLLAGVGSVAGAGITASAIAGWAIGQGLNEYTPVQEWLGNLVDSFNERISNMPDTTLDGDE